MTAAADEPGSSPSRSSHAPTILMTLLLAVAETSRTAASDPDLKRGAAEQVLEPVERPHGLSELGDFRSQLQTKVAVRDEQTPTGRSLALRETILAAGGRVRRDVVGRHDQSSPARQSAWRTSSSLTP